MKNIIKRWHATWNPDMYHGWGQTKRYFEGWYFKVVDNTEGYALAFIPGISMSKTGEAHAFIQVLDGKKLRTAYHRFDIDDFKPDDTHFSLQLADNQFSTNSIKLNLPDIQGELFFKNTTPWIKMLGAPGIMGWYSFVPFMECYHGIVSLDHSIEGSLTIEGKTVDFTNGRGYIEKDWGISFPRGWFWMQSNHFFEQKNDKNVENIQNAVDEGNPDNGGKGVSLIASVAHIPFLGSYFIGYIVGFWFKNKLYRFATYTGAKMKARLDGNHIELKFKDGQYLLEIEATKAGTGNLVAPLQGEMTGKVSESLQAVLHVRFFHKDTLIFEGQGRNAGLEAAGDIEQLLTNEWRR
jgi:tocopherol cyclase